MRFNRFDHRAPRGTQDRSRDPRNDHQARRADAALNLYVNGLEAADDKGVAVRELLADLRHWCDRNGMDYADEDRRAYQHYLAELFGKQ